MGFNYFKYTGSKYFYAYKNIYGGPSTAAAVAWHGTAGWLWNYFFPASVVSTQKEDKDI